jgi:hypothetical protein
VARSAANPSQPTSHLGNRVPDFVVDEFPLSYGDPQPVQASVPRRLGPVQVHWQVDGGPEQRAVAVEWDGGLRYGGAGDLHIRRVRGPVTGTRPGDIVKVWFSAGGKTSTPFTYQAAPHRGGRLLVVIGGEHRQRAETLSQRSTPAERLAPLRAALEANGIEADLYDVEAHGQVAPDPLGVLGHYQAVVWTADEGPRAGPGTPLPETVSRLANQEMLALRDYLNEGGRLLYTGRDAGRLYAQRAEYNPVSDGPCLPDILPGPAAGAEDGSPSMDACVALSGEFFQYWLGAYEVIPSGGRGTRTGIAPVDGVRPPFAGTSWDFAQAIASGRDAAAYSTTAETIGQEYPGWTGRTAARYRSGRRPATESSRHGAGTAAVVETPWSLLFGFGFEDIATVDERTTVMGRALSFLLPSP